MIFYPPTTLPPSLPYSSLDDIIVRLCDKCLALSNDKKISSADLNQHYEITMAIVDFWFHELEGNLK